MKKIVFAPPQTGPPAHPSSASLASVSLSPRKYFPTWKYFPAPLHDQSRLKKIPKGSFPPKDVCPRFGTSCCRGVADAPARSSERASHAQNSLRLFHRVRVHVHLSRALSRAPSASFNLIIRFVPSRPSVPESSSTRPRLACRTFSLARVHSR